MSIEQIFFFSGGQMQTAQSVTASNSNHFFPPNYEQYHKQEHNQQENICLQSQDDHVLVQDSLFTVAKGVDSGA